MITMIKPLYYVYAYHPWHDAYILTHVFTNQLLSIDTQLRIEYILGLSSYMIEKAW
jgi:hypothetical protein